MDPDEEAPDASFAIAGEAGVRTRLAELSRNIAVQAPPLRISSM
jgi:hypothetical protein